MLLRNWKGNEVDGLFLCLERSKMVKVSSWKVWKVAHRTHHCHSPNLGGYDIFGRGIVAPVTGGSFTIFWKSIFLTATMDKGCWVDPNWVKFGPTKKWEFTVFQSPSDRLIAVKVNAKHIVLTCMVCWRDGDSMGSAHLDIPNYVWRSVRHFRPLQ